jgi:hypothetical protein
MLIELTVGKETLALRGQDNHFEICRFKPSIEKRTGEPRGWEALLWYSTLESALKALLQMKVIRSDASTLLELQQTIKTSKEQLAGYYV